jgi:valyl-tRNA synthetase
LPLFIKQKPTENPFSPLIIKLGNLSQIAFTDTTVAQATSFLVGEVEHFILLANKIDTAAEKEKLQAEINYLIGFLKSVDAKLNNNNFTAKAKPEVLVMEQKKKADTEQKIQLLQQQLATF